MQLPHPQPQHKHAPLISLSPVSSRQVCTAQVCNSRTPAAAREHAPLTISHLATGPDRQPPIHNFKSYTLPKVVSHTSPQPVCTVCCPREQQHTTNDTATLATSRACPPPPRLHPEVACSPPACVHKRPAPPPPACVYTPPAQIYPTHQTKVGRGSLASCIVLTYSLQSAP